MLRPWRQSSLVLFLFLVESASRPAQIQSLPPPIFDLISAHPSKVGLTNNAARNSTSEKNISKASQDKNLSHQMHSVNKSTPGLHKVADVMAKVNSSTPLAAVNSTSKQPEASIQKKENGTASAPKLHSDEKITAKVNNTLRPELTSSNSTQLHSMSHQKGNGTVHAMSHEKGNGPFTPNRTKGTHARTPKLRSNAKVAAKVNNTTYQAARISSSKDHVSKAAQNAASNKSREIVNASADEVTQAIDLLRRAKVHRTRGKVTKKRV